MRKHGGRQHSGWRFDFRHLHQKSGALSPFKRFAFELRDIIRRQPLPGYRLFLEIETGGRTLLAFEPFPACGKPVDCVVPSGTRGHVPSGTAPSCQREPKRALTPDTKSENRALNLESNQESNFEERRRDVQKLIVKVGNALKVTSGDKRQTLDRNASADTPAARQRTPTTSSGDRSGGAS